MSAASSPSPIVSRIRGWCTRAAHMHFGLTAQLMIIAITTTLAAGGVITIVMVRQSQTMLREQIVANNMASVDLAAVFAYHYVEGTQSSIRNLARSPFIEQSVLSGDFGRATPELREFLQLNPRVNGCSLIDSHGVNRATGTVPPTSVGTSVADREWFQQAAVSGEPYLGVPTITRSTGQPVAPYVVAIRDANNETKGMLACGISLGALNEAFAKFQTGPEARASLTDRRKGGIILAHSDRSRILKPVSGRNRAVDRMLSAERGFMETPDSAGRMNLAFYAPVPSVPWGVLIMQPTQAAFAAIDERARENAIYFGIFLLLMAAGTGLLARRVTQPLARLAAAAYRLSAGQWNTRLNFTRHDELGDLGRTFDHMAATLAEHSAQLKSANQELQSQFLQLRDADRLKSEFLANMSHELRTPLNAIIGFAQLIHDGKVGPINPDQQEYLGDMLNSATHLLQLINDVLDLAKVESGKLEFVPEPVTLSKLIAEVSNILQPLAASKRLKVSTEIAASVEHIVIDPAKLKQILYNYLSNAIKFTGEEGHIALRASEEDAGHFRVEVEDSGIGIAADQIEKLFMPFQQLDASAAKRHQGTGLGLALTKKLVEAQGGQIGVRSVPGQGSVFFATLPKSTAPENRSTRAICEPAPSTAAQKTILVIEDSEGDIRWLNHTLETAGYGIDIARTGAEGIAKAQTRRFAAVLLDLILPDTGGWDILHSIRKSDMNRNTPVIVVTVVAERGVAKGFPIQDYLIKPLHSDMLLQSLHSANVIPNGTKPKILVVDDDPATLKLAQIELQSGGYEVACHASASGALAEAGRSQYAAVVLDLLMPNMDGFEFLERFRDIPECRSVPVIVWTSKDISAADIERLEHSTHAIALKGRDGIDAVLKELRRHVDTESGVYRTL